jgi:hypothetical protein
MSRAIVVRMSRSRVVARVADAPAVFSDAPAPNLSSRSQAARHPLATRRVHDGRMTSSHVLTAESMSSEPLSVSHSTDLPSRPGPAAIIHSHTWESSGNLTLRTDRTSSGRSASKFAGTSKRPTPRPDAPTRRPDPTPRPDVPSAARRVRHQPRDGAAAALPAVHPARGCLGAARDRRVAPGGRPGWCRTGRPSTIARSMRPASNMRWCVRHPRPPVCIVSRPSSR